MKKTRLILLLCALTATAWSLPGLAQAKGKHPGSSPAQISSMFDGGGANLGSMFDGGSSFDGGSMFDGG
jgi:hypothetical protein